MTNIEMLSYHLNLYNSWILNEDTCRWEAPVAMPELTQEQIDNKNYYAWNEQIKNWELKNNE
jgi:hypothetical protein